MSAVEPMCRTHTRLTCVSHARMRVLLEQPESVRGCRCSQSCATVTEKRVCRTLSIQAALESIVDVALRPLIDRESAPGARQHALITYELDVERVMRRGLWPPRPHHVTVIRHQTPVQPICASALHRRVFRKCPTWTKKYAREIWAGSEGYLAKHLSFVQDIWALAKRTLSSVPQQLADVLDALSLGGDATTQFHLVALHFGARNDVCLFFLERTTSETTPQK